MKSIIAWIETHPALTTVLVACIGLVGTIVAAPQAVLAVLNDLRQTITVELWLLVLVSTPTVVWAVAHLVFQIQKRLRSHPWDHYLSDQLHPDGPVWVWQWSEVASGGGVQLGWMTPYCPDHPRIRLSRRKLADGTWMMCTEDCPQRWDAQDELVDQGYATQEVIRKLATGEWRESSAHHPSQSNE